MRKGLLGLGIIFLLVGLVFTSLSREVVKPEPIQKWVVVDKVQVNERAFNLTVQGNLIEEDKFKVTFRLAPTSVILDPEPEVDISITDPYEQSKSYIIPIGVQGELMGILAPLPEDVANVTGSYKVFAYGVFVFLNYLALEKIDFVEKEPYYPNSNLFPVGVAIVFGGIGVSFLGAKISKSKKIRNKRRLHKAFKK